MNNHLNIQYTNYYLFLDTEIIYKDDFSEKLSIFMKNLKSKNLTIKVRLPKEGYLVFPDPIEILNPNVEALSDFYQKELRHDNHNSLPICMFDYNMYDESGTWEVYVSFNQEFAVFGCNDDVNSLFNVIFQPYSEESLEEKYDWIKSRFADDFSKNKFINDLESTYNFSKFVS